MARFLIRRILLGLLTLLIVSIIVFVATQALPGDAAVLKLGRAKTPQSLAALRAHFHLNEPIYSQYWGWLTDTLQGNLGNSFLQGVPVTQVLRNSAGNTFWLALYAALVGIPLGYVIGIVSAVKRGRTFDNVSTIAMLVIAAIPDFVLAILLILLFSVSVFRFFPAVSLLNTSESAATQLNYVVLPALTLALVTAPYVARMIRASMIEVLESDYVSMARLKGVKEWRVVVQHALVNGAGPSLQVTAISLAYLAGGVVVVESVFRYPGLGSELVQAVLARDLPVVQAIVLIFAAVYVVVNIVADLITIMITPRLRTAAAH
jgi:peptide/nickel transport system permease protein